VAEWGFPMWMPWWDAVRFGWQHWHRKPQYSPNTDEMVVQVGPEDLGLFLSVDPAAAD
jgi:hypothetical protein